MLHCPSVAHWLAQFTKNDAATAALALRELDFISSDQVRHDLEVALRRRLTTLHSDTSVILESLISQEDVGRYFANTTLPTSASKSSAMPVPYLRKPTSPVLRNLIGDSTSSSIPLKQTRAIYSSYFPSDIRDSEAGSEKYLDLVLRNVRKQLASEFAAGKKQSPFIEARELLSNSNLKHITIFVITDLIGSGKQAVDFLSSVMLSASLHTLADRETHIRFIAWSASEVGSLAIEEFKSDVAKFNEKHIATSVHVTAEYLNIAGSYTNYPDAAVQSKLLDLFKKYPKKQRYKDGLGFGGAASNLVIGSLCANNLPDLFHAPHKKSNYTPLFPNRIVPPDIRDFVLTERQATGTVLGDEPEYRERLKRQRLVRAASRPNRSLNSTWQLLLLAEAGYSEQEAVHRHGGSAHQFSKAQNWLVTQGWLSLEFTTTKKGSAIIRQFGSTKNLSDYTAARYFLNRIVDAEGLPYYPQSVRGVR